MKHKRSVFIFRRDLRLVDNTGLIQALKESDEVLPVFILTPEQLDNRKNSYKSDNCIQFMSESLIELNNELKKKGSKLRLFYDTPDKILKSLFESDHKIEAIYVNCDYTPYSKKRDQSLIEVCQNYGKIFISEEDILLHPVGSVTTSDGKPYSKFTPFYKSSKELSVSKPQISLRNNYVKSGTKVKGEYTGSLDKFYTHNKNIWKSGGRKNGLKIIKSLKTFKLYNSQRDNLTYETTYLSPHLKFGTVSIREVYAAFKKQLGNNNDLIKQLYWRDFYANIVFFFPHVIGGAMKEKYNNLKWINNKTEFEKWKKGQTGYPIVDAAMRSMNQTGFMHNRSRMIVSNFLVKILMIDWRWGEKYFAQMLYDYDPANNNGGWQWSSSTGTDSQPYFRIFNPWLQSSKFDPQAEYIKKWVPELGKVPSKDIHNWYETHTQYKDVSYPGPMIDYKKAKAEVLKRYKDIF